ncbi:MAG TPA: glycosyltransferase family 87 protein [Chitinophagaceae bacterium]|nr:glycosyltransferase family 87 protein [Chitinophagaceae bacterium]
MLSGKNTDYLLLSLFGIVFCISFYINFSNEPRAYFHDLRNRIVGTRLLKQDTSIYFYKWNPSQPLTLYDPYDRCNIRNNMITSPPSLLFLMQPAADLSYAAIARLWTVLHYLFFLLTVAFMYAYAIRTPARRLVLLAACLLLFSDHWRDSVFRGQSHFLFPAIIAAMLWITSRQIRYNFFYAGLLFALLVWLRPIAIIITPFLFLSKETRSRQLLAGLTSGGALLALITAASGQVPHWIDYYHSCREWVRINTSGLVTTGCNHLKVVEGKVVNFGADANRLVWQSEIVDIFHLAKAKLQTSINAAYLLVLFALAYAGALLLCYKKLVQAFSRAILAGILLYWFSEMTAPVLKMSYYYVELFVVVLFFAGRYYLLNLTQKTLLAASLLFTFLPFVPMNLTIAEFCTAACILITLLQRAPASHDIPVRY